MASVLLVLGILVLVVTGIDVVWTVLAAGSGAGPVTARMSGVAWRIALAFGRRPEGPRHGLLAVFGVAIVAAMLLSWVVAAWGAWWMISAATDGAVRVVETGRPADLLERAWFVGFNLFTVGSTTYAAGKGLWHAMPVAIGANGLVFLTLGISYLVPVASAVAERRQLAQYILSLGETPEEVVVRAWDGTGFGSLADHLVALVPMVHLAGERHLTYPALAYFHSARERASSSVSVAVLDDALALLAYGVDPCARPAAASLEPLRRAIGTVLDTLGGSFVAGRGDSLPPPALQPLRRAGIPTVDDDSFRTALAGDAERRRLLAELLEHDGWTVEAWERRRPVS